MKAEQKYEKKQLENKWKCLTQHEWHSYDTLGLVMSKNTNLIMKMIYNIRL